VIFMVRGEDVRHHRTHPPPGATSGHGEKTEPHTPSAKKA
jgi:hypothetical protein